MLSEDSMEQGAGPATQFACISAQSVLLRSINDLTKACCYVIKQRELPSAVVAMWHTSLWCRVPPRLSCNLLCKMQTSASELPAYGLQTPPIACMGLSVR